LEQRLNPRQIHQNVRRAATELSRRFHTGGRYFVADPLGLMSVTAGNGDSFSQFSNFDLSWGSGDRFYSRDHKTLLIIAEPRESAVDYKSAERIMQWTHAHIQSAESDPNCAAPACTPRPPVLMCTRSRTTSSSRGTSAMFHWVSIVASLLLCCCLSQCPLLLLSLLPTSLGIFVDHGIASFYPAK